MAQSEGPFREVLHWLGPLGVTVYYLTARSVVFCMLQKPRRFSQETSRNLVAVALSGLILALFIAQAIVCLVHAGSKSPYDAQEGGNTTVYLLSSSLLWLALFTGLLPVGPRIWYPHVGAWGLASLVDAILLFPDETRELNPTHDKLQNTLHSARVLCFVLLMGSALAFLASDWCVTDQGDTEPLLASAYDRISSSAEEDDDAGSDDEDEPERTKELKKQQKQRLADRGSWLAYLKDFRVLLPLVWPSDDYYVLGSTTVLITILIADRALNVLVPRQMGLLVDQLANCFNTGIVPYKDLGLWMLFVWLRSNAGLDAISQFAQLPLEQYAYRKIGTTAFRHIMTLSMDFHNNKDSGELIAAVGQGQHLYRLVEFLVLNVGPMFFDLIIAFFYISSLFDTNMALVVLFIGVTYTWFGTKMAAWTVAKRRRFNNAWRSESKTENEAIHNWQTVSHFNRAGFECDRYGARVDEFNAAERSYYYLQYSGGAAQSLILIAGRLTAALLAARKVSQGLAPVGSFVTLISYWSSIEGPLARVSYSVRQLSQMLIDSERLMELLNTKPSVVDAAGSLPITIDHGKVEFRDVNFSYDPRKPTLQGVSFVAEPGDTIALVGETGGGKTTILKLLYRYYDTNTGSIQIDGQNIRDVTLDSLRDSFGMVPQDPALFNTSILENVRYARLDATDDEVYDACRAAAIHDKILSFPDGYRTTVGERGVKLSGGELQRVAIARAILRSPRIVLLDEATSMIDAETEHLIQKAFRRLTRARTTFVVAHRLSTIQHADKILVISNGKIAEMGTHDELIAHGGKYVSLWAKQSSK